MEENKSQGNKFFKEDKPHGFVKRTIYKKYLQAFIPKTQNTGLTTIIIDGFAGCGRYGKTSEWPEDIGKYGSPLIAVMATLDYQLTKARGSHGKIFGWDSEETEEVLQGDRNANLPTDSARVKMFFVEKKKSFYEILVKNLHLLLTKFLKKEFPTHRYSFYDEEKTTTIALLNDVFSFVIKIVHRQFKDFAPPAELQHKLTESLTFLDPSGYMQTPVDYVCKFAPNNHTQIFINFMTWAVNKNDPEQLNVNDVRQYALDYQEKLKPGTGCPYALMFEMRNENDEVLYHLIFTTHHLGSVKSMKEAMNRGSQQAGDMVMSDHPIIYLEHRLDFGNLDDPREVADAIFEEFQGCERVLMEPEVVQAISDDEGNTPAYKTISEYIMLCTKFVFRKTPLKILQDEGKITDVVDSDGNPQRLKGTFPDGHQWYITFAKKQP